MSAWGWARRSCGRTSLPDATEFRLRRVRGPAGPLALLTIDNGADHTRPTLLGRSALESLARVLPALEQETWSGLVITGKPFVFAAGADLDEFPRLRTREDALTASRAGQELFARIRALPYPTLAAINGACVGGGVELALHCDLRTISTAVRHFGCPECFLGFVPAWGGTQLLPPLVGVENALRLVVLNPLRQNRLIGGRDAFELGFADRLFEPAEFLDESIAFLAEAQPRPETAFEPEAAAEAIRRARAQVDDAVHGAAPAAYRALDLIELAASGAPLAEGLRREAEVFADLLAGPEARASLYAYDLVERRGKRRSERPAAQARPVRKVGFAGAGLMATQLATLFLVRLEVPIVLRDVRPEAVEQALGTIHGDLGRRAAQGRIDEAKARFLGSLATSSAGYDGFAACDLVVEAVFEELEVKRQVFAELESVVRPDCVLATNTSALSVTEIARDLVGRERVVGMHFFNPVALMPLVELVRSADTDDATLATAWDAAERLRKRPLVVADTAGFVVNRVLTRMTRVLMDALEHGSSVDEIDEAILGLGMPLAPSAVLAMVGPTVANHVLERMHEAYPDRFPLSPALAALAAGSDDFPVLERRPLPVDAVRARVLDALADEIRNLLDEGVVPSAADVDTALLLGAGWPFFLGGITKHLDDTGVSERVTGGLLAA